MMQSEAKNVSKGFMGKPRNAGVERLKAPPRPKTVTTELAALRAAVHAACPEGAEVSFLFDGKLHLQVDVRSLEDVTRVEAALPGLAAGAIHSVRRGNTPGRAFHHRVVAIVER